MGVPKQKWTSEEEASLKAGIAKHGLGKWSTILKDSEFASILRSRSNVDLKDKWRNLQTMASGCGSRQKVKPSKSKTKPESISRASKEEHDMQICIPDPPRLDNLILETVANWKESCGCTRTAIAEYIENNHSAPMNLDKLLKAELNSLTECGKLVKIKHQYKIAPTMNSDSKKFPSPLLLEVNPESYQIKILTKAEIDAELEKMRSMTPQQAADMAMKAVAEAEAAISEAEKAAMEAETAEADAKLAKVFAAAAMRALKQPTLCTW